MLFQQQTDGPTVVILRQQTQADAPFHVPAGAEGRFVLAVVQVQRVEVESAVQVAVAEGVEVQDGRVAVGEHVPIAEDELAASTGRR